MRPNQRPSGGHPHHARTRTRSGRCRLGSDRAPDPASAREPSRWAVTGPGSRTGCASGGSSSAWSPAALGSASRRSSNARSPTRRCGLAVTNGSRRACSTRCASMPCMPMTASSVSTSPKWRSTAPCTRHPVAGKGPGKTPQTGPNWDGSGPSPPTPAASRSAGPSMAPTATTSSCSPPRSTTSPASGLLDEIETLHLDRGYDYPKIRAQLADRGLDDLNIQRRAKPGALEPGQATAPTRAALGGRRHQLVAEQLRPAPSQHRPANPTPTRSALPGDHPPHHRQAHRLAGPLEPRFTPYPLGPLSRSHHKYSDETTMT